MDIVKAIILGIVEGVTEFLPISSTGHLILTAKLMNTPQTAFLKTFEIAIQLGAILAVVILYWRSFLIDFKVLKRVIAAFIPTAILGLLFYKIIKHYLLGSAQVVLWALFLGGIFLIIFELLYHEKEHVIDELSEISYQKAIIIGLFQSVAMVPGVSRAAATIIGGLSLGLKRKTIVEFSFLLAVPTMLAATVLDMLKTASTFSPSEYIFLAVGFFTSFLVALFIIKAFLAYIKKNTFILFGVYRIILSGALWFLL